MIYGISEAQLVAQYTIRYMCMREDRIEITQGYKNSSTPKHMVSYRLHNYLILSKLWYCFSKTAYSQWYLLHYTHVTYEPLLMAAQI